MSRSLPLRLTPFICARIRYNQRLLSSAVDGTPSGAQDAVHMTDNCIRRMKELHAKEAPTEDKMLRLSVETGGCSGFQYVFLLDDKTNPDDRIFENDGIKLVVDKISYDFVKGATVDYVEELIRSAFLQHPFDIPIEAFPFEIFKQAFVAVQSCVVHLQFLQVSRIKFKHVVSVSL